MSILLLGPHGSGKTTLAYHLVESLRAEYFSVPRCLRGVAEKDVNRDGWVRDDVVTAKVEQYFEIVDNRRIVFDNYPGNLAQAGHLDRLLKRRHSGVSPYILEVDPTVAAERMARRLFCPECHRTDTIGNSKCACCHVALRRRPSDTPAAIRQRLNKFARDTAPVIEIFRARGAITLDSSMPTKLLAAQVLRFEHR